MKAILSLCERRLSVAREHWPVLSLPHWGLGIGLAYVLVCTEAKAAAPLLSIELDRSGFGQIAISWESSEGEEYLIETADRVTASWKILPTEPIPLMGGGGRLTFTVNPTNHVRFFRVMALNGEAAPIEGMSYVDAGGFEMGDHIDPPRYPDELPVHRVFLSGYYIALHETTKAEWDEVYQWAIRNGYEFDNAGEGKGPEHPVHTVNWHDAVKWCNARSEMDGLTPVYYTSGSRDAVYRDGRLDLPREWVDWHASGYRLPTEAEWEKAARGHASGLRFPWGNQITHDHANYWSLPQSFRERENNPYDYDVSETYGFHPDYNDGTLILTSPVGSFAPNGFGLYDVVGNVGEWCWDWYDPEWYAQDEASMPNPTGPEAGRSRVVRSGHFGFAAFACRVSEREALSRFQAVNAIGFRVVRSLLN